MPNAKKPPVKKDGSIHFRCTPAQRKMIERKAKAAGFGDRGVSAFIMWLAHGYEPLKIHAFRGGTE